MIDLIPNAKSDFLRFIRRAPFSYYIQPKSVCELSQGSDMSERAMFSIICDDIMTAL